MARPTELRIGSRTLMPGVPLRPGQVLLLRSRLWQTWRCAYREDADAAPCHAEYVGTAPDGPVRCCRDHLPIALVWLFARDVSSIRILTLGGPP